MAHIDTSRKEAPFNYTSSLSRDRLIADLVDTALPLASNLHPGRQSNIEPLLHALGKIPDVSKIEVTDPSNFNFEKTHRLLWRISHKVLLPNGWAFIPNYLERPDPYAGRIDQSSWEKHTGPGGRPIWFAKTDWQGNPTGGFGVCMLNFAFADERKLLLDAQQPYRLIVTAPRSVPEFYRLGELCRRYAITENIYAQEFGFQRIKGEEIQHAKDHHAVSLRFDIPLEELSPRHAIRHLNEASPLAYYLAGLDASQTQFIPGAVAEFVGKLGGVQAELERHLNSGKPELAHVAAVDFLTFSELSNRFNQGGAGNCYKLAATMLKLALQELGINNIPQFCSYIENSKSHPGIVAYSVFDTVLARHRHQL